MGYCEKCGTKLNDEAAFCPNCGAHIDNERLSDDEAVTQELVPIEEMKTEPEKKKNGKLKVLIPVVVILALALMTFGWFKMRGGASGIKSSSAQSQNQQGQKFLESQDYDKAEVAFKEAIKVDDKDMTAYSGLVDVYIKKNDKKKVNRVMDDVLSVVEDGEVPEGTGEFIDNYFNQDSNDFDPDSLSKVIQIAQAASKKNSKEGEKIKHKLPDYTSKAVAACYLDKIKEYEKKYGEAQLTTDKKELDPNNVYNYTKGLCLAKTTNIDGDAEEELILAYGGENLKESFNLENPDADNALNHAWTVEAWAYQDGEMKKVYTGQPTIFYAQDPIGEVAAAYKVVDNKICFVEGYRSFMNDHLTVKQVKDGKSSVLHEYQNKMTDLQNMDFDYTIDGQTVSDKAYSEAVSQWMVESSDMHYFTLFTFDSGHEGNDHYPDIKDTIQTTSETKKQLEKGTSSTDKSSNAGKNDKDNSLTPGEYCHNLQKEYPGFAFVMCSNRREYDDCYEFDAEVFNSFGGTDPIATTKVRVNKDAIVHYYDGGSTENISLAQYDETRSDNDIRITNKMKDIPGSIQPHYDENGYITEFFDGNAS